MTQTSSKKVTTKPVATKLSLPTSVNEPSNDLLAYFVTIFGRKGIGKSTFASSYPNSLNFQFERGRKNLPILMVPKSNEPGLTFKSYREYFKLFIESPDLDGGIFDTIDAWYDLVYSHFLAEYGGDLKEIQNSGNSFAFWSDIKMEIEETIQKAQDAGKTMLFVSHEKLKDHPNSDGTVLQRIEPTCAEAGYKIIQRYCDFVLHYDYVGNDRVMTIRSPENQVWVSCGRNDMFCDPDGAEINRFKIPNKPELGFETLEKAFNNELRDYDYEPPKQLKTSKPVTKTGKPAAKK